MGAQRVVAWIAGILAAIGFICSLGMPILFAGEYLILTTIIMFGALYFGRQAKSKPKTTIGQV